MVGETFLMETSQCEVLLFSNNMTQNSRRKDVTLTHTDWIGPATGLELPLDWTAELLVAAPVLSPHLSLLLCKMGMLGSQG